MPKCPACEKELTHILYTEHGRKEWNGRNWQEASEYGDAEYVCPECDYEFDYEELEQMKVFG